MKNLIHVIYINSLKNFINIHQGDKYTRGETQSLEQKKINLFIYNNNGQEINLW